MPIPRSIACAALAVATAVAVVVPAQAGLAATASLPTDGLRSAAVSTVRAAGWDDDADSGSADDPAAEDDGGSDDVQVVDGTDAPEDDSDVLAGDASGSGGGSAARRGKTSGRWARVAPPTAVRASLTGASRARVTWRAGIGGVLAQRFLVELRAGGSVLQTTTFSSARSATFWTLGPAKRYAVRVTAVAADGTRRTAIGASIRTPAAKPARAAKGARAVATADPGAAAKAAARHAKAVSLR